MSSRVMRFLVGFDLLLMLTLWTGQSVRAQSLPTLEITVFAAPSQSIWFPTLIQKRGLDKKHGFNLVVKQKPGQVAYAEYAAGIDKVCYCNNPAAVARFVQQGADIALLWNVFSAEYVVITADPKIQKASDLAGKTIAADTSTGAWALAAMLLTQNGLDLSKAKVQSAWGSTQVTAQLIVGRADALVMTPVEAAYIQEREPGKYHTFSITDPEVWEALSSGPGIPSIAFGVWRDWLAKPGHLDLVRRFYAANIEVVDYAKKHPEEAADIVSKSVNVTRYSVEKTLKLRSQYIRIAPAGEYAAAIKLLTQNLLPEAKLLDRPFSETELASFVSDFKP